MKKAIISGVSGQDGAYLAQYLLNLDYKVYGTYRRSSSQNFWRLEYLGVLNHPNLSLLPHDLTDLGSNIEIISKIKPDEFYNLAAQSFVGASFQQPISTALITGLGPVNVLEAIKIVDKKIKFYQASSSEMFGKVKNIPQNESTDFYPRSPYGAAKLYAHWMTVNYRENYNLFAVSGILFNHESPLRGEEFVTRKITNAISKIKHGKQKTLTLGNLDAKRDWGFAGDYVKGMHMMLQTNKADTYVLATNKTFTVREFVTKSFECIGIKINFRGEGVEEKGYDSSTNEIIVDVSKDFFRPVEVDLLIGDYSHAKKNLGWSPSCNLDSLCEMMVDADLERNS